MVNSAEGALAEDPVDLELVLLQLIFKFLLHLVDGVLDLEPHLVCWSVGVIGAGAAGGGQRTSAARARCAVVAAIPAGAARRRLVQRTSAAAARDDEPAAAGGAATAVAAVTARRLDNNLGTAAAVVADHAAANDPRVADTCPLSLPILGSTLNPSGKPRQRNPQTLGYSVTYSSL